MAALAAILNAAGAEGGVLALLAVAAVARMCGLAPLVLLPPARTDGAAYAAERPARGPLTAGWLIALALAIICLGQAGWGVGAILLACALALAAALAMVVIAQRQIGGQTGDIAGAAEQLAEIAFLSVLAAGSSQAACGAANGARETCAIAARNTSIPAPRLTASMARCRRQSRAPGPPRTARADAASCPPDARLRRAAPAHRA